MSIVAGQQVLNLRSTTLHMAWADTPDRWAALTGVLAGKDR